jgi:uncharacterized lipoprotein YmbA
MTRSWQLTVALCWVMIASLFGCRSLTPPVAYYFMSPMGAVPVEMADTDGSRTFTVGIRTVELPGYVNRLQMVQRTGANEIKIASYHRWADFPDRMVPRVLGENLQLLMADAQVYSPPWPLGVKPDVAVDIAFLELIGTTDKKLLLSAVWTINRQENPPAQQSHRSVITEPITGKGFDELAAAHSRVLAVFSQAVAESLRTFNK